MYTEKISRITETRNGIRQPHSAKSLASMKPPKRQIPMTASDRKKPSVAVVWIHDVS